MKLGKKIFFTYISILFLVISVFIFKNMVVFANEDVNITPQENPQGDFIEISVSEPFTFLNTDELKELSIYLTDYNKDSKNNFYVIFYDNKENLPALEEKYSKNSKDKTLFINTKDRNLCIWEEDTLFGVFVEDIPYCFDEYSYMFEENNFLDGIKTLIFYETGYSAITKSLNENWIVVADNILELNEEVYNNAENYNKIADPKVHIAFINKKFSRYNGSKVGRFVEHISNDYLNKGEVYYFFNLDTREIASIGTFKDGYDPIILLNRFGVEELKNDNYEGFLNKFFTTFDANKLIAEYEDEKNTQQLETKQAFENAFKFIMFGIFFIFASIILFLILGAIAKTTAKKIQTENEEKKKEYEKFKPDTNRNEPIPVDTLLLSETSDTAFAKEYNENILNSLQKAAGEYSTTKEKPRKIKIEYTDEYLSQLNQKFKNACLLKVCPENFIAFNNLVEKYNELPADKKEKIERKYASKIEGARNKVLSTFKLSSYKKIIEEINSNLSRDKIKENNVFIPDLEKLQKQIEAFEALNEKDEEVISILNVYMPYLKEAINDYNDIFTNKKYKNADTLMVEDLKNNITELINNITQSINDKTKSSIYMDLLNKTSTLEGLNSAIKSNH